MLICISWWVCPVLSLHLGIQVGKEALLAPGHWKSECQGAGASLSTPPRLGEVPPPAPSQDTQPSSREGAAYVDIWSNSCTLGYVSILLLFGVLNVTPVSHCAENQLYLGPSDKNSSPWAQFSKGFKRPPTSFSFSNANEQHSGNLHAKFQHGLQWSKWSYLLVIAVDE